MDLVELGPIPQQNTVQILMLLPTTFGLESQSFHRLGHTIVTMVSPSAVWYS